VLTDWGELRPLEKPHPMGPMLSARCFSSANGHVAFRNIIMGPITEVSTTLRRANHDGRWQIARWAITGMARNGT
jgi:hypothetical protein